jgi:hypothetical protein
LVTVRRAEWRYYQKIRRRLEKSCEQESFYGNRHELGTCATLLRNGARIANFERPDFTLESGVGLECASARIGVGLGRTQDQIQQKLAAVVSEKERSAYSTGSTVLVVDITNLNLQTMILGAQSVQRATIEAACGRNRSFGSVICTLVHYVSLASLLTRDFVRFDQQSITPALRAFLDRFYPKRSGPAAFPISAAINEL